MTHPATKRPIKSSRILARTDVVRAIEVESTHESPRRQLMRLFRELKSAMDVVRSDVESSVRKVLDVLAEVCCDDDCTQLQRLVTFGQRGQDTDGWALDVPHLFQLVKVKYPSMTETRVRTASEKICSAGQAMASAQDLGQKTSLMMPSDIEPTDRMKALRHQLSHVRDQGGDLHGVSIVLMLEVLNVIRVAAAPILKKEYGDGIAEVELDQFLERVRASGEQFGAVGVPNSIWGDPLQNLDAFLDALVGVDDDVASHLEVVRTGTDFLCALRGSGYLAGVALLNTHLVLKPLTEASEFVDNMLGLAAVLEREIGTELSNEIGQHVNHMTNDQRIPGPRRFASYALANAGTRALAAVATDESDDVARLIGVAKSCAARMRTNGDRAFEHLALLETLVEVTETLAFGNDAAVRHFESLGLEEVERRVSIIVRDEDCEELVKAAMRAATETFGSEFWATGR